MDQKLVEMLGIAFKAIYGSYQPAAIQKLYRIIGTQSERQINKWLAPLRERDAYMKNKKSARSA